MKGLQFVAAGLMGLVLAASVVAAPREDRSWIFPVSELKPGMTGYGLSVFKGETPEKFNVEFLGVLHNGIGAGVDMILAKLDHPALKDIGVIAGMSGSPVYIGDRMVGAVSYGYTYSKVAIAGITPVEKMVDVYDRTGLEPPPRDIALGPVEDIRFGEPVSFEPKLRSFGNGSLQFRAGDLPEAARAMFGTDLKGDDVSFKPLSLPVLVSSCSPQTASLVKRFFESLGMEPIFTPLGASAAAADTVSTTPVVNGGAMGIPYILGDISLGAIGTVSYTDGKKLVAFGHPMSARGPVVFPLGSARVVATLPSVMRPVKLGEITGLAGSIHEDRQAAVGGVVGKIPYMVPMSVHVIHDGPNKTDRTYHFKITDNRLFAPRMSTIAVVEACTAGERAEGDQTASIHYRIETDDGRVIEKDNTDAGSMACTNVAFGLLEDMAPIYSNEFQVRSVRKITAEVRLRDGIQAADLESAFVDRDMVKQGETITVSAYVKPWRQERQRFTTTLTIPADLPNGRYNVAICDSRMREASEVTRAPGLYRPKNFADMVRILDIYFPGDRLYVMLAAPDSGITIDGSEFSSLPPSFQHTLSQLHDRQRIVPTIGAIHAETRLNLPFILSGSQIAQIEVDRRGGR